MNKKSHSTHKSRRGMEKLRNVYNLIVKDRSEELSKLDKGDLAKMTFTDVL